ncbi:MAG: AmmeMemoRadiSam system radical SAM enzyme [Euryarchaeota archaeon]|nr:AmmeMemoRadiSam system radical SAM enzyme [Euryarchaeota archaeon]
MTAFESGNGCSAARWWHQEGTKIRCDLCPHRCLVGEGHLGICGVRKNDGRGLCSANYGKIAVSVTDPIEKKPMFHYRPGARLYSLGTFGCNMDCMNCQNFSLARSKGEDIPFRKAGADEVVREAVEKKADGIAWTFNEPIVWYEFILETSAAANKNGLFSLLNTNGFIEPGPREELLHFIHAMNIDVKGFTDAFYRKNCGASLGTVLDTCLAARRAGVHVELTYLLIPTLNDDAEEVKGFCEWTVENMGPDTPVHFFRFQPFYKLSHLPEQSVAKLKEARDIAKSAGLRFPYHAGVVGDERQNTFCPNCGEIIVKRASEAPAEKVCVKKTEMSRFCPTFSKIEVNLREGKCPACGESIPIILS